MKLLKMSFVLMCLVAYAWTFCGPAKGEEFKPRYISRTMPASAAETLPFKAVLERMSPLYADRQMTVKLAEIPVGYSVVVLEKYDAGRGNGLVDLRVAYADGKGKEYTGWVYGTLHVNVPSR